MPRLTWAKKFVSVLDIQLHTTTLPATILPRPGEACGMSRCTISKGSSALRGLTTAARVPYTTASILDLLSIWKPTPRDANDGRQQGDVHRTPIKIRGISGVTVRWNDKLPPQDSIRKGQWNSNAVSSEMARRKDTENMSLGDAAVDTRTSSASISASVSTLEHVESTSVVEVPALPLSPLMDPAFLQAKQKHREKKQRPAKLDTNLQQQIAKNPFALALSSDIRRCGLTDTPVPRYFLQDFKMISHPQTQIPYFLPTSLSRKKDAGEGVGGSNPLAGLTGYTIANKSTLDSMQNPAGGYFKGRGRVSQRAHHRLMHGSWKAVPSAMKMLLQSTWRPDMADFVLELMRRRCTEHLSHLWNLKRGYMVGCVDWEDAAAKPQVAAFLWTGGKVGDDELDKSPTDFATFDLGVDVGLEGILKKKRKVPVYNLRALFGQEKLAELSALIGHDIFSMEVITLKHKKMTVDLQMRLWKLQGYVADHHGVLYGRDEDDMEGDSDLEGSLEDDDFLDGHKDN